MNPDFAVRKVVEGVGKDEGRKVVIVDTKLASWRGRPYRSLSPFEKRKFENMVVLAEPASRIKVIYE